MATAGTEMSMSLDGFIAGPPATWGSLFAWYGSGEVAVPMPDPRWTARTSEAVDLASGEAGVHAPVRSRL